MTKKGFKHSEESKRNMREACVGRVPPDRTGSKQSEETKRKCGIAISKALTGKKRKPFTKEHLKNMSIAQRKWRAEKRAKNEVL